MNALDMVITDLQVKVKAQNFNLEMYGGHSIEFQTARIILNTTLDTLVTSRFINDYSFHFNDNHMIISLAIYLGDNHVRINPDEVRYFVVKEQE